ncbi:tRNA (adenosine(37)-N6)-dimethylallyltransferase MiaA [Candidatus Gottesmanbacteria bacterium]|nr:tRNA (adenosine(37)-N6)-dimethylallyltransferase MiaA [Candidatus Gottesmanbacteria bacterium]
MSKLLIICGPTATGKTALALHLAKQFNGELVSADSRQLYKGLDALTGKERSNDIPIWLYDIIEVGEPFSAHDFVSRANDAITNIEKRGKLPIAVGGTGFYLKALTEPIATLSIPPNALLRKQLAHLSLHELQVRLEHLDGSRWQRMNASDRQNPRRLIRAIEVVTAGITPKPRKLLCQTLWIGLTASPRTLKERIEQRVTARFHQAIGEVKDGAEPVLGAQLIFSYKQGEISKQEALRMWTTREYQYAKRQLTWFAKQKDIRWFDVQNTDYYNEVEAFVAAWYTT